MWKETAIEEYPAHYMSYLKNYSRSLAVVLYYAEVKRVLPQSHGRYQNLWYKSNDCGTAGAAFLKLDI